MKSQSKCNIDGIQFYGAIDAGFNGNALCSKRWLRQYINYLEDKDKEALSYISRRKAVPQYFVFGPSELRNRVGVQWERFRKNEKKIVGLGPRVGRCL